MTALTADDAVLVTRLRQGDATAARELYERHGDALLRFGVAMTHSRQTAEDVVHDTFVELLRHPNRFDSTRGTVIAFLFAIARHRMSRLVRVDQGDVIDVASEQELETDVAETLDRIQSIQSVRAAVLDLPRVHREVIVLCDLEELPYASVATVLGCPIGTVRSRLSRARALLATRLDCPDEPDDIATAQKRLADVETVADRTLSASDDALGVDDSALTLSCRGSAT